MAVPRRDTLNPPLWEWGHVAWFQEYWIARNPARGEGSRCDPEVARAASLLEEADALYDSSRVAHATRWSLPLPSLAGTQHYLADTLTQTLELLSREPEPAGDDALYFYRLAALHEEMHAEAGMYTAHALGIALPSGLERAQPAQQAAVAEIVVPAQVLTLGWQGPGFAFDNERAAHEVGLGSFRIDTQPVSWSRYMKFVEEGGYDEAQWWDPEGQAWLHTQPGRARALAPGDPQAAALHLTWHEARAWCRWAARRLPTEAEWECAALVAPGFSWGGAWEWTESRFEPYPGFEPHPYRDYSRPWFGSRRVLRGAAPATADTLAHPRYRNFFEPHRCDVFAGFRSCAAAPRANEV
jgi:ergothioneine biosynthesis protein EgtB